MPVEKIKEAIKFSGKAETNSLCVRCKKNGTEECPMNCCKPCINCFQSK